MVSENYNAQLKWFAEELIKIRTSLATDGYNEPIDFDPALVMNCTNPDFNTAGRPPEQHVERMLKAIRAVLISGKEVLHPAELKWRVLENGHIEIDGFTTRLLRSYLKDTFGEVFILFGEAQDERERAILTYLGEHTDILLSGKQLAVFRCLRRNFEEVVTLEELHEAIRSQSNINRGQSLRGADASINDTEKASVHSAVATLKTKFKEAADPTIYQENIESTYGGGYTMII